MFHLTHASSLKYPAAYKCRLNLGSKSKKYRKQEQKWTVPSPPGQALCLKKRKGSGLTRDVDDLVVIGEPIEASGRALGVGTHVLEV